MMLDPNEYETVSKSWLVNLGIIGQLGAERAGVKVGQVAFSARGSRFIATQTNNEFAFVWKCDKQSEWPRLIRLCHTERILDLKISDRGMILVGRSDGHVDAFNISEDDVARLVFRDQIHCAAVLAVEFDPNNEMVYFSGGVDGFVRQHVGNNRIDSDGSSCTTNYPILELKGQHIRNITVNPSYPDLIAISTNQADVQLFRRFPHPDSNSHSSFQSAHSNPPTLLDKYLLIESFCPLHLLSLPSDTAHQPHYYPTCIKFHPNGKSILINYFLDHTYEFDIQSLNLSHTIITTEPSVSNCAMADTPWWVQFNACSSVFEQIDLVKEVLYESNCAKELNLICRYSALLSIAIEMLAVICNLAKEQGMSNIFLEEVASIRSHSLYLQAILFVNRNFRGDAYTALKITSDILRCSPFDVSAKILQCKIHIQLRNVAQLVPLMEELEILLPLNSTLPTLISMQEDIQQLKKAIAELLLEMPQLVSEGNEGNQPCTTTSMWRARYEGFANLDECQEVSFLGVDGVFVIGCNGNKLIVWDRLTSEIVHFHELTHGIFPKIQAHPNAMFCALSDPYNHSCIFWGQIDLKNRMEMSIRQLDSSVKVLRQERRVLPKMNKIVDVTMPSSSNEEHENDNVENNVEIVDNKECGTDGSFDYVGQSTEFRVDNSTSLGEETRLEHNKINVAVVGDSYPYFASCSDIDHTFSHIGIVIPSNYDDTGSNSELIPDEEAYFTDDNEDDDPNHEYQDGDDWVSDESGTTSLSSEEGSTGYHTSDDNSATASVILDVYYDAVNASIEGYPLELKDLLAIEEMLKHNEFIVQACKDHPV